MNPVNRHAILINAFQNENQLNRLINHLKIDFDIYVHIDKNSSISVTESENVRVFKHYRTYWGSLNFVKSIILLMREAAKADYERYILISGQDLPIKSNKNIKDYFDRNRNVEFIQYFKLPYDKWDKNGGMERVTRFWGHEPEKLRGYYKWIFWLVKASLSLFYILLPGKKFKRKIDYNLYGGSNFMDLTGYCVRQVLSYLDKNPEYIKRFRWTLIPDEIFFQTIILNIKLDTELRNDNNRYIDWVNGPQYPRILTMKDLHKIRESNQLFARKFHENIDSEIINVLLKNDI